MSDTIPEMNKPAAVQALVSINESISRLKTNRALLKNTLGLNRGDGVDSVVDNVQTKVEAVCARLPKNLSEEDARSWLREEIINVAYNYT